MRELGDVSEKSDRTLILTIPGEVMFRANQAALGEDEPVASNATAEGRANNRRVEIIVSPASVSKR